jgi:hypothetical protein
MNPSIRAILVLALFAPGCARCTDAPREEEPSETQATATQARAVSDDEVPTPTVEQLPLPQDFGEHAGQTVTDENYREELDRIARDLGEEEGVEAAAPSPSAPSDPR